MPFSPSMPRKSQVFFSKGFSRRVVVLNHFPGGLLGLEGTAGAFRKVSELT